MISRGVAWKRKNLKLVPSEKLLEYEGELKAEFESKIEDAVKRQQDYDTWKKAKADNIEKEKEKKKPITSQMKTARSYKGKTKTQSGQGRKNGGGKRVRIEKIYKTENKPRKVSNQRQQRKSRN